MIFTDSVNKTLYIPLYGKAYVSSRGLFLSDKKAQEIWEKEGIPLHGKAKSKWLALYMGMRSAVFDEWLKGKMREQPDAVIIHIGCGLDSRVIRVGTEKHRWYDVDFPEVISERGRYFNEDENYRMIPADIRNGEWLKSIPVGVPAIVVMEGVSMYLTAEESERLARDMSSHFSKISLLADCYTELAAKLSDRGNPVKEVGVTRVYGTDTPVIFEHGGLSFIREHEMTPQKYIALLRGAERHIFRKLYAGGLSKKLYRLYEYKK